MDDWLQLTEEDLERARRWNRSRPTMPGVIIIRPEDVPDEQPPAQERGSRPSAILTITLDDLMPVPPQATGPEALLRLENLSFDLINQARQEHLPRWVGTGLLKWHEKLAAVARGHSADMLRRQYVDHVSPEGVTAAQRIERYGVGYVACGENIGIVYGEASGSAQGVQDVHAAFMNQPRSLTNHRANVLNPIWTHVGVGIAYNPDGALVLTQNFISAPAARLRGR